MSAGHTTDKGWEDLANAIVLQAVTDYKKSLKYLLCHPNNKEYNQAASSIEHFFRSGWYQLLTNIDGKQLMLHIRHMVRKEVAA